MVICDNCHEEVNRRVSGQRELEGKKVCQKCQDECYSNEYTGLAKLIMNK